MDDRGKNLGVAVRVRLRVHPGAKRTGVGGVFGEAIVVRVQALAVDGKATQACLKALAEALDLPASAVRLRSGAASRDKVVEVDGDPAAIEARLAVLRESR